MNALSITREIYTKDRMRHKPIFLSDCLSIKSMYKVMRKFFSRLNKGGKFVFVIPHPFYFSYQAESLFLTLLRKAAILQGSIRPSPEKFDEETAFQ